MKGNTLYQLIGLLVFLIVFLFVSVVWQYHMFIPETEQIEEKEFDLPVSRSVVQIDEKVFEYAVNQSDWAQYSKGKLNAKDGTEKRFTQIVNNNNMIDRLSEFSWNSKDATLKLPTKGDYVYVPTWVMYEFCLFLPYDD